MSQREMNFDYFQIWTVRAERVDKKKEGGGGVICLVFMFPFWVMVLKLSQKVHFLEFCVDIGKKSKSIREIYIYASERFCYALSENGIAYFAMTNWKY